MASVHLLDLKWSATLHHFGELGDKLIALVAMREWDIRNLHSQEMSQWLPAITDLVLQQLIGWNIIANLFHECQVFVDGEIFIVEAPFEVSFPEEYFHQSKCLGDTAESL